MPSALAFGVANRALIPIGMHHLLNSYPWFEAGDYHGKSGDIARFLAGDPTAGQFMTGFFPIMMFGLRLRAWRSCTAPAPSAARSSAA